MRRAARPLRRSADRRTRRSRPSDRAPGSSHPRSPHPACPHPASACRMPSAPRGARSRWRLPPASPPSGSGAGAAAAVAWDRGCPAPWRRRRRQRWKRRTRDGTGGRTHGTPGQGDRLVLPARATAVNLLHQGCGDTVPTVDEQDPPGPATVVRGVLGTALAVAAALLLIELVAERSLNWELLALGLALWGAWSFFGSLSGALLPLGRIFGSALTGGEMPPGTRITIEQETATLERLVGAVPPPSPHRLIIAGIRLAELHVVAFAHNAGQTAGFAAGFQAARGRVIVTLDADLQNDPADVPALVAELERSGAPAVVGSRTNRHDSGWKRLQSRIANGVRNRLNRETIRDTGCSLKAFRADAVRR